MRKLGILILCMIPLLQFAGFSQTQENTTTLPARVIHVNYNAEKGPHCQAFKECIGAGRFRLKYSGSEAGNIRKPLQ
jgi:hypothetical protein